MGSHPTKALIAASLLAAAPTHALEPGWGYSPLPGEGDRASMGCARGSTDEDYSCLAVRCEDDFSIGIHIHSSRPGGTEGMWEMTLDREARQLEAVSDLAPYDARLVDADGWLLDGLRHGTFVYLRHHADPTGEFAFIDLGGSFRAINEALYWCAPRVAPAEQNELSDVDTTTQQGETR
ncbi:hypothetical protein SAMN06295905_2882 [Devosia lucknowensis]|uniref:Uncharacterized protein n=1 Tax=Devosia lucknowensis TaxID=1096929 RepID=A0A1Y6G631_9HYPH|nr:hypothetical protein [Devosia lucknowensis]SMQ85595.1 hypothetical protein SAMN06295905_2882 [Devosia lucknowensis]